MSENERINTEESVSEEEVVSTTEAAKSESDTQVATVKKSNAGKYIGAAIVVIAIILGVLYMMEKEGRATTGIFTSLIESQQASVVVAVVNGEKIINSELDTSIQQFSQAASAQGVDVTSPEAIVELKSQALDVLVNTKLLKQEALKQGVVVTDEQATERLEAIQTDIGGAEVLAERMAILGIEEDQLHQDIRDELLIQKLLDTVFAEANITVTEEEVSAIYEEARSQDFAARESGAEVSPLPELEEVRGVIEGQIKTSKEQMAIDDYLNKIREGAEIEIK